MNIFDKKSKRKQFEKVSKGKGKKGTRKAEEALLQPEPIMPYGGELPVHKSDLDARSALIVFKDDAQRELVASLFDLRTSATTGKSYITDISLLDTISKMVQHEEAYVKDGQIHLADSKEPEGDVVTSMEEFQKKYFPDDVGKRCFQCGRKYKKKKNPYGIEVEKIENDEWVQERLDMCQDASEIIEAVNETVENVNKIQRKRRKLK